MYERLTSETRAVGGMSAVGRCVGNSTATVPKLLVADLTSLAFRRRFVIPGLERVAANPILRRR
jgi:hypothetical protein